MIQKKLRRNNATAYKKCVRGTNINVCNIILHINLNMYFGIAQLSNRGAILEAILLSHKLIMVKGLLTFPLYKYY